MLHSDMKDTANYKSTLVRFTVQCDKLFLPVIIDKTDTFFSHSFQLQGLECQRVLCSCH